MINSNERRTKAAQEFSERLTAIMDAAEISGSELSRATGLSYATIRNLRNGKTEPGFTITTIIADYFGVPLDYLCGRSDKESAEAVLKDYCKNFMQVRRASYEDYATIRRTLDLPQGFEAPWPYNLLDQIFEGGPDQLDIPVRPDQETGLMEAIEKLKPRIRDMVLSYYRDGKSTIQLGQEYKLTPERISQIIRKGVFRLRHASNKRLIIHGRDQTIMDMENVIKDKRQKLEQETAELDQEIAALDHERLSIDALRVDLNALQDWDRRRREVIKTEPTDPLEYSIEDMDLSVRSFNILKRSGLTTVRAILDSDNCGRLICLRGMGKKSYNEIMNHALRILSLKGA